MKIFLSYAWKNTSIADDVTKVLEGAGFQVTRDVKTLGFKDSVTEFMKGALDHDFVVQVISEEYLHSKNCMFECCNVFNSAQNTDKFLPIVVEANTLSLISRIEISAHWTNQLDIEAALVKSLANLTQLATFVKELEFTRVIVENISPMLQRISSDLYVSYAGILTDWEPLLAYIRKAFPGKDLRLVRGILDVEKTSTYDEKLAKIRQLQTKFGQVDDLTVLEAMVHADFHSYSVARALLVELHEKRPDTVRYLNNLAMVLIEEKQTPRQAEELLLRALELEPTNTAVLVNLGGYYSEVEVDLVRAEKYFNQAFEISPSDARIQAALGLYFMETKKDLHRAGELLKSAYEALPNEPLIASNYGIYLSDHTNSPAAAMEVLKHSIELNHQDSRVQYNLGNVALQLEDFDTAHQAFSKCLFIDPSCAAAYLGLGHVYKKYFRNNEQAEKNYRKAIELVPLSAQFHYNYGIFLYESSRHPEALAEFSRATEIDPRDWESWNFLGVVLGFGLGKKAEAVSVFQGISNELSIRTRALYNSAMLLENESPILALAQYEAIVRIDPNDLVSLRRLISLARKLIDGHVYLNLLKESHPEWRAEIENGSA